jgi:hypothetical protein
LEHQESRRSLTPCSSGHQALLVVDRRVVKQRATHATRARCVRLAVHLDSCKFAHCAATDFFICFFLWLYPGMRCCMLGPVLSPGVCCVGVGDKAQESLKDNSLWGLNPRPMAHKTIALTTELRELISHHPKGHIMLSCCKPEPRATM